MKKTAFLADALGHSVADKRVEILRLIDQTGSISQAAREAGVSYKAAWQAVDTLTNLAGISLVEKVVGGAGGGGARLTEAGAQLLRAAALLTALRHEVLHQLQAGNAGPCGTTLAQLAIRTSMRNHLPCEVLRLEGQDQVVRVVLQLPGGEQIVSRITRASAELLGLRTGQPVLALFKAMAVAVCQSEQASATPNTNRLSGQVSRISRGASEDEIAVSLPGGLQIVGFAGTGCTLALQMPVTAVVDESAVVIALAD